MTTQHIGAAGELLVQYLLVKHDVDTARLTTDAGIDLVAYSPTDHRAKTIQVKTVRAPSPAGGRKGAPPAVGWRFPHDCPAELLALALLATDSVWIFTMAQARRHAQQHTDRGSRLLYWYTDASRVPAGARHESAMAGYRLENSIRTHFLKPPRTRP